MLSLLQMLRRTSARKGTWQTGNALLSICRSVMQTNSTVVMFKPLCGIFSVIFEFTIVDVLSFLVEYFDDVDIRDRAHFYLQLLTHISGDKIKVILAEPELLDDEETGTTTCTTYWRVYRKHCTGIICETLQYVVRFISKLSVV
jgi:hypothetical protein